MVSAGAAFAGENIVDHGGVDARGAHHVGSFQAVGFHTLKQIVGERAGGDGLLVEILLNAGAGEQTVQQFLGQMFFGDVCHCQAPCHCVANTVLRPSCAVARFLSVQDVHFAKTRRKIQLSADVWPARVADNGRCHPCGCGGGKDGHARYQASTIKLTCIQNANLRTY